MPPSFRRQQLNVTDEEGLLRLQEEFFRAQAEARPAAQVTRIISSTSASAASQTAAQQASHQALLRPATVNQLPVLDRTADTSATSGTVASAAAKVTGTSASVCKAAVSTAEFSSELAAQTPSEQQQQQQQPPEQPMCPSIPGILVGVQERDVSAAVPLVAPTARAAAAFPAAVHRKQSKFALGRRKQLQQVDMAGGTVAATATAGRLGGDRPAALSNGSSSSSGQRQSLSVGQQSTGNGNTADDNGSTGCCSSSSSSSGLTAAATEGPERAGIHEVNMQRLAGMSDEEVQQAQSELVERFAPEALEFLRNRRTKAQQQQQQTPGQVAAAADHQKQSELQAPAIAATPAAAAAAAAAAAIHARPSMGFQEGLFGPKPTDQPLARTQQHPKCATIQSSSTKCRLLDCSVAAGQHTNCKSPPVATAVAGVAAVAAATDHAHQSQAAPLPAVARLRFSLDGSISELTDVYAPAIPEEEVLMRDSISRAAGAVPQGYTLPELRVLVRSSHPPQRAAGFRMLSAVLRRAQPSVMHLGSDGQLVPQPVYMDVVQEQHHQQQQQQQEQGQQQQQQQQQLSSVTWSQVWDYAIIVLRAVLLCRLGLDDDNSATMSAAADVAAVLLSPSSSELLFEEVGTSTVELSWPLSWRVSLRRLSRSGVWDSVEGLVGAAQQQQPTAAAASSDASMADTPEDLAAVDSLAGFLATDPLPRIRFLLQHRGSDSQVVPALLAVLTAVAASSSQAAETVVRCPGMAETLLNLLDMPGVAGSVGVSGPASQLSDIHSSSKQEEDTTLPQLHQRCGASGSGTVGDRSNVLRLLRLLSAASPIVCQLLMTEGLDTVVQYILVSRVQGFMGTARIQGAAAASAVEDMLLVLEAMRVWRIATMHGVYLAHMDAMFQSLAPLLQPPSAAARQQTVHYSSSSSSAVGHSSVNDESTVLKWQLTTEAHQLVEVLVRHALAVFQGNTTLGSAMISPGCAAAIAQEAAAQWLNPEVVHHVAKSVITVADCQLPYILNPTHVRSNARVLAEPQQGLQREYSSDAPASSHAAWFRVLAGFHPALLIPPASAVLAGFAAGLQYLSTYWRTLGSVSQHLPAELLDRLAATGLPGYGGSSNSSLSKDSSSPAAARDHSLHTLLSASGHNNNQQQKTSQLGSGLLQHCLGLLHAAGVGTPATAAAAGDAAGPGGDVLARHALAAPAATLLCAVCELQQQLLQLVAQQQPPQASRQQQASRLSQQQQQQQQQQHQTYQQQLCILQQETAEVLAENALHWVPLLCRNSSFVFEPWQNAWHSMRQYQLRLLIRLARPVWQQHQMQVQQRQKQPPEDHLQMLDKRAQRRQQQQQQLLWRLFDGLLCVLPLSAPGQEADALAALQLLFDTNIGGGIAAAAAAVPGGGLAVQVLAAALQAVQRLLQQAGPMAAAAAGIRTDALPGQPPAAAATREPASVRSSSSSCSAQSHPQPVLAWLYPSPAAAASTMTASAAAATGKPHGSISKPVDPNSWCQVLLEGYAVTWLSVIAQQQMDQHSSCDSAEQQQQADASGTKAAAAAKTLAVPSVYVSEVQGSRLPVPPEWLMMEILALPHQHDDITSSSPTTSSSSGRCTNSSSGRIHPVAAALLFACGLEQSSDSSYLTAAALPSTKLEALLQLLYLFNAGELLVAAAPQRQQRQQQQQQLKPSWQQSEARWAAAVLSQQYCMQVLQQQQLWCQQQQRQDGTAAAAQAFARPLLLFSSWASSAAGTQLVDRLVRELGETSMGDPLFGCHVALLLLPAAGVRLQRAVFSAMLEQGALHVLPPAHNCIGGAMAYVGVGALVVSDSSRVAATYGSSDNASNNMHEATICNRSSAQEDFVFAGFDIQFVGDMAKSLARGDLRKALQLKSLASAVALHGIAALCLDQKAWAAGTSRVGGLDCGLGLLANPLGPAAANSANKDAGMLFGDVARKQSTAAAVDAAAMALNVLRGVLRACSVDVLQQLVNVGVLRGIGLGEQSKVLIQAAHGDAMLMTKVRQLLDRAIS